MLKHLVLIIALFINGYLADSNVGDRVCQSDLATEEIKNGCQGPRLCSFPNPEDCQGFIKCQANNNGSPIPSLMDCPLGLDGERLYWNDDTFECDYEGTCGETGSSTETTVTTESTTEATTAEPTTTTEITTTTEESTTESGGRVCDSDYAREELESEPPCPAPRNCMFSNPDDCQGFIQCQPGGPAENYIPIQYEMDCPDGEGGERLYWNDDELRCGYEEDSTCPRDKYHDVIKRLNKKYQSLVFRK